MRRLFGAGFVRFCNLGISGMIGKIVLLTFLVVSYPSEAADRNWVLVTALGTPYTNQSLAKGPFFPSEGVRNYWDKGYYITSLAYGDGQWYVVLSAGVKYTNQQYNVSTEFNMNWIKSRWSDGYRVTNIAYGDGKWVTIVSKGGDFDGRNQKILHETAAFPSAKEFWDEGYDITSFAEGEGRWHVVGTKGLKLRKVVLKKNVDPKVALESAWNDSGGDILTLAFGTGKWHVTTADVSPILFEKLYISGDFPEQKINEAWKNGQHIWKIAYSHEEVEVYIKRLHSNENCTLGKIWANNVFIGYTLEYPWRNNTPWDDNKTDDWNRLHASRIRAGFYRSSWLRYHHSDAGVYWRLQLEDREGRTGIQLHIGSKLAHSEGCILIGKTIDVKKCEVYQNSAAMHDLKRVFYGTSNPDSSPRKNIVVEIVNKYEDSVVDQKKAVRINVDCQAWYNRCLGKTEPSKDTYCAGHLEDCRKCPAHPTSTQELCGGGYPIDFYLK